MKTELTIKLLEGQRVNLHLENSTEYARFGRKEIDGDGVNYAFIVFPENQQAYVSIIPENNITIKRVNGSTPEVYDNRRTK